MVDLERDSLSLSRMEYDQREKYYMESLRIKRETMKSIRNINDTFSHLSNIFEKYAQAYIFYVEQKTGKRICSTERQSCSSLDYEISDSDDIGFYGDVTYNPIEQSQQ